MSLYKQQQLFARALLDPELSPPEYISKCNNRVPQKNFSVYRNNVIVSLTEALAATYPVIYTLVGEEFFWAMSKVYIRQNLPKSPILSRYGETFAEFIDNFQPVSHLNYLSDIARLEWAWLRSYHAADAMAVDITALAQFTNEQLNQIYFIFHPSLYIIKSQYPVYSIWADNSDRIDFSPDKVDMSKGEYVVINRRNIDVIVSIISCQEDYFIAMLKDGNRLGDAVATLLDENNNFDLSSSLNMLFSIGAVVNLK